MSHNYCQQTYPGEPHYRCTLDSRHAFHCDFGPLDEDGNLIPRDGTIRPTRDDFGTLLQAIVTDVGGEGASIAQPLAEHFVRYLDGIYGPRVDVASVPASQTDSEEAR